MVRDQDRRDAEPQDERTGQDAEAGAQPEVDGRSAEDQSEYRTDQDRLERELRRRLGRRHKRLKGGRRGRRRSGSHMAPDISMRFFGTISHRL